MSIEIKERVSLKDKTTLAVGGEALHYIEVATLPDLAEAVSFAQKAALPLFVLGGGSNVLVSDAGFAGLVLKMQLKGRRYEEKGDKVIATFAAGEVLDEVVAETVKKGWWGLENLSAIPGTVGATPIQNVGAYGVEISDLLTTVEVYDCVAKAPVTLSNEQCRFGYRDSIFKQAEGKKYIITSVTFCLSKTANPKLQYADLAKRFAIAPPSPSLIRQAVIEIRSAKFPDWHVVGTAGSFFKNPIIKKSAAAELAEKFPDLPIYEVDEDQSKVSLGFVLDKICHLKGYTVNHVGLYEAQALVLVASRGATATEVLEFSKNVSEKVFEATNILIEREVTLLE